MTIFVVLSDKDLEILDSCFSSCILFCSI